MIRMNSTRLLLLLLNVGAVVGFLSTRTFGHVKYASSALQMSAHSEGKVALVTGSAQGIGRCIAEKLANEGCKVVINHRSDRMKESAQEFVDEIKKNGGEAISIQADVSNPEEVKEMFERAEEAFGSPVYICVNNAGITKDTLAIRMKPDQWQAVIDVNLNGVFYVAQEACRTMSEAGEGRIINIASVVGQIGNIGQANYAAAKGGVLGLTRTLAREMGSFGVTVNTVCPGFIETAMTKDLPGVQAIIDKIPLGRFGKPEEVAEMVSFLGTNPGGAYITGHSFDVDGGIGIGCT